MRNLFRFTILLFFFFCIHYTLFAQREGKAEAMIGSGISDSIEKAEFIAQPGVRGYIWINNIHAEPLSVDSFRLFVMRVDTSIVFSTRNAGAYFNVETNNFFKQLQKGDKIIVYDIFATVFHQKRKRLPPLEYIIK